MSDLISREALKEDLFIKFGNQLPNGLLNEIVNAPTVEQFDDTELQRAVGYADGYLKGKEERPTGEWIDSDIPESILSKCSVCNFQLGAYSFNYCPNCGAKMKGGETNEQ